MESEEEKGNFFSEVSDIELIDFLNEDDFLVDHRFRDSLEDLRLSGFIHISLNIIYTQLCMSAFHVFSCL